MSPDVSLSIVSHGQATLVTDLLTDLSHGLDLPCEIILTLNIPEDESFLAGFVHLNIVVIRNEKAKGFGANHNAAFRRATGSIFCVVNPDVRLTKGLLVPLVALLSRGDVAVCGPVVLTSAGAVEDSARRFPTFLGLVRRKLLQRRHGPDYAYGDAPLEVDWMAGMFLMFDKEAYGQIGGFDERFYMYFEDADICWRLKMLGYCCVLHPSVSIVHDARRASRKNLKHFLWHLKSAGRYLLHRLQEAQRKPGG
jgi:N-acetylglucosaminyl-diphospho-decaprenol L-rhamnosyltransferase